MIQEQEEWITKGAKDTNSQGKHQEDWGITLQHTQVSQHTNDKVATKELTEKQHDKREKAIWKVKVKTNINEITPNSNKKYEEN
ncbi:hypothetical protein RDI58_022232 [Solanum bulbocastanum]|uniref:Uncharacterized protein n=1 Tax=Solanum bulbocastanum TaxID=147425 RepID=A0AAN8T1P0_SOLBU